MFEIPTGAGCKCAMRFDDAIDRKPELTEKFGGSTRTALMVCAATRWYSIRKSTSEFSRLI